MELGEQHVKRAIVRNRQLGLGWIATAMPSIALVVAAAGFLSLATADEPMIRFVQALRDQDDFELALDYLNSLSDQNTLSATNRELLPFEKAQTLSQYAARSRDLRKAGSLLTRAQEAIEQYRPADQSDLSQAQATQFRGDLLFNQARVAMARAQGDRNGEAQRQQLNQQTRTLLTEAAQQYDAATASLREALRTTPIDPEDNSTVVQVKRLRGQYTYLKTRGPTIGELIADTFPADSSERTQLLKETAQQATDIWQKYYKYSAALESCLVAARCQQKLGQHASCLTHVNDVLALIGGPSLLPYKRQALAIAVDSWQQTSPYPWDAVIQRAQPLVRALPSEKAAHPQWQTIKLELARALRANADEVAQQKGAAAQRRAKELTDAAIAMAQAVAGSPGGRQRAGELLQQWDVASTGSESETARSTVAETMPADFAAATQTAKLMVREVETLLRELAAAAQQSSPQQDAIRQRLTQQATATLAAIDKAIAGGHNADNGEALNNLRYLQCFCHFAMKQYLEAAVIGEFLLAKRARVDGSRQAAALAMQSYSAIAASNAPKAKLASQRLVDIGKALLQRYPGSTEAASAAAKLAQRSLRDNEWQTAESYFAEIPADSRARTLVAASLGRQAWLAWSKNTDSRDDNQLATAKRYFEEAVKPSDANAITYGIAEAALLLAEVHLAQGDLHAAINRLESATIAPLALVASSHPALVKAGRLDRYRQDSAMTAIKAYMAALQQDPSDQQWIDKATEIIGSLQQTAGSGDSTNGNAAAAKRLTSVYRSISQRLIKQFETLPTGKPRVDFGVTLADFLGSLEKRATDSPTVVWAGATMLSVANTLKKAGADAQAKPIFDQAVSALDRAESMGPGSGEQATALTRELKRQRALAQLGAGNFDVAIELFSALLTQRAGDLTTQMDAALALQQKGRSTGQAADFAQAITGTAPVADPKTKRRRNAIWGWRKLVKATRGNKQFVDAFHKCLYHMIECRYEMGKANHSADGVQKALAELNSWTQRTPEFGGTAWKAKFADLKQRIQTP